MKRKNREDRTRSNSQKKIKKGKDAVNTGSVDQSKYKRNTLQLNGSKGLFVYLRHLKQREALREAYNILDEYVEIMYPSLVEDNSQKSQSSHDKGKQKSMSEMLSAEIKAVKGQINGGRKVSPRRFFQDCYIAVQMDCF